LQLFDLKKKATNDLMWIKGSQKQVGAMKAKLAEAGSRFRAIAGAEH